MVSSGHEAVLSLATVVADLRFATDYRGNAHGTRILTLKVSRDFARALTQDTQDAEIHIHFAVAGRRGMHSRESGLPPPLLLVIM